jgi:hypothetical protein
MLVACLSPCSLLCPPPQLQGISKLWSAWAPTLEDVRLVDLSIAELDPWASLPALCQCSALTSLRMLLREPMSPALGVIDIGALPASLRQLALRHTVLTAGPATETRMKALESLSLRQCTVVRPGIQPHPGAALGPDTLWHAPLLHALPALRSVELVGMPHLRDEDFVGIGALTALTSLLVCASGTVQVCAWGEGLVVWASTPERCRGPGTGR